MKDLRMTICLVLAVVLAGGVGVVCANDIYSGSGTPGYFGVGMEGPFAHDNWFPDGCTVSGQAEFNWSEPSMTFQSLTIQSSGGETEPFSVNYTVGPGQSTMITASITLSPFEISLNRPVTLGLTPSTNGNYSVTGGISINDLNAPMLFGTYTISGPTETVTGLFSSQSSPWLNYPYYPGTLQTNGYPDYLILGNPGSTSSYWTAPVVNTMVDGVLVELTMGTWTNMGGGDIVFGTVPEPTTLLLFGLGGLALRLKRS